jgi:type I restriction enzyme S subunit
LQRIRAERRAQWEAAQVAKRGGQLPLGEGWKAKYAEPEAVDTAGLPELPEGWAWANLDELMTGILAGKNFSCLETPPQESEYGLVKISAVTWGTFNPKESKTITDPDKINLDYLINTGDFLFSRANTVELVGACVIVDHAPHNLLLSDKVLRFDFSPSVNKDLVLHTLRSRLGRNQIEEFASGNQLSMRNISQEKIYRIAVPFPPEAEQAEIVAEVERRLTVLDALSQTLADELRRAERLRQSILHRAFTGRLVPQDATDEPAAALLARLRATPAAPAKAGRGRKAAAQQATLGL